MAKAHRPRRRRRLTSRFWILAAVLAGGLLAVGIFEHQAKPHAPLAGVSRHRVPFTGVAAAASATALYPAVQIPPDTPVGPSFNWTQPTDGPYPTDVDDDANLWIDVSLSAQRVYIMNGPAVLYTMITSSGMPGPATASPAGTLVPGSHGCLHLTISDAKWIYDNMPEGTKVVVQEGPNPVLAATVRPQLAQSSAPGS